MRITLVIPPRPLCGTRLAVAGAAALCLVAAMQSTDARAAQETAVSPASPAAPAPSPTIAGMSLAEAEALVREIVPKVEEIRGLHFKSPVPIEVVDDATARIYLKERIEKSWPKEQVRAEETAYRQLGLLPDGVGLLDALLDVLEEQAGGYYDPERNTFYLLGDMPRVIAPVLIAHELTHALDDQHFNLDSLMASTLDDSEKAGALGSVIEGSGTLVMSSYMVREITAGRLGATALAEFAKTEAGETKRFRAAPPLLQRSLLGPYVLGQTFLLKGHLLALVAGVNGDDITRALQRPPESMEQILHPNKYWEEGKLDQPRPVPAFGLCESLGPDWKVAGHGSMGEILIALLTGSPALDFGELGIANPDNWTNEAASGWGGDVWQVCEGDGRKATILATLWDSEPDAEQFEAALPGGLKRDAHRKGDAVLLVAGDANGRGGKVAKAFFKRLESTAIAAAAP